jgi:hypothetical protein
VEQTQAVGKEYAGPSGIARRSEWLTAEDLVEGRDVKVRIEKVIHYPSVTFEKGRTEKDMLALQFVGKERKLILNATNRKTLNRAFGVLTGPWKGQDITLYVGETQMKGEDVKCVRIRAQRSRIATAAEEALHETGAAGEDEPVAGVGVAGAAPAPGAEPARSDEEAFRDFQALAERVTASFGGERLFLKEAPKKSGSFWTCDAELASPEVQLWIGGERRLAVSRVRLAELGAKLEALI